MKSTQVLALISLTLGIVGGALLLVGFLDTIPRVIEGRTRASPELLVLIGVGAIAIVASVMIWRGSYLAGGAINIILGVVAIYYARNSEGALILISGILGVVAPQVKD
jgi:hypothetical protein